jgi:hypothetical protein
MKGWRSWKLESIKLESSGTLQLYTF